MTISQLALYQWLTGDQAIPWLAELAPIDRVTPALVDRLRRDLASEQVRGLLELHELRRRARAKFSRADAMYFTRLGLEQATDEIMSYYKATSFAATSRVADLCSGVGGDLLGIMNRCRVVGYDRDQVMVTIANANAMAHQGGGNGGCVDVGDVENVDLSRFDAWHLDPDRRPTGQRTTHVGVHEPDDGAIDRMLQQCPHALVKLSPAARGIERWEPRAECEWVGHSRECQQLVLRFGDLAREPGRRTATVLGDLGAAPESLTGDVAHKSAWQPQPAHFLIEPHAAVRAAGLTASFARHHGLACFSLEGHWLTADQPVATRLAANFELLDRLPFDRKRVRAYLRQRAYCPTEVKSRERSAPPEVLLKLWSQPDGLPVTLIVARIGDAIHVCVARRVPGIHNAID